jgi:hypothetical protein
LENKASRLPSIGQFILSIVSVMFLWSGAFGLFGWGLVLLVAGSHDLGDPLPVLIMSASLIFSGVLMLPSAYYSLWRLMGKPVVNSHNLLRKLQPAWWILALPPVLILGQLFSQLQRVAWLGLPTLHLLAIGIPTIWLLYLALRGLPKGSNQRMWGVFGSGLVLGPFLIFLFETLALLAVILASVIYLSSEPELLAKLLKLASQLQQSQPPEALIKDLWDIMSRPAVLFSTIVFGALIVPMIEELVKPVGVWLLFGRKITPAAGFAAGALSGAGYALLESLALASGGQEWSVVVLARNGTSAVHILTTALMGWALVQVWQKKHYLQCLLAYFCAVAIHGLWNGLTLLLSFNLMAEITNLPLDVPGVRLIGSIAPLALMLLAAVCFFGLIAANRLVKRSQLRLPRTIADKAEKVHPEESML